MQYTLAIFERLASDLPPLVPQNLSDALEQAVRDAYDNPKQSRDDLEEIMILFGKQLWPYRQAFAELLRREENHLGETFFVNRLSPAVKSRYRDWKMYGGNWHDLVGGTPLPFFPEEERPTIQAALVDVYNDLRRQVRQKIASVDRWLYQRRVAAMARELTKMERHFTRLREMADSEQEHPDLADEIRAQILSFEHGLSLLGPPHSLEAIEKSEEHFAGRRREKKQHAYFASQRLR